MFYGLSALTKKGHELITDHPHLVLNNSREKSPWKNPIKIIKCKIPSIFLPRSSLMVVTMIFSLLFFLLQMNMNDNNNNCMTTKIFLTNLMMIYNKTLFNREVHREMTTYYKMVLWLCNNYLTLLNCTSDCSGGLNCLWSSIMILKQTNTFSSFSI